MAYEAVPRESGWDEIISFTGTLARAEKIQHFFSALQPPLQTMKELDDKAADWLSRRQRMKHSEVSHRSACFAEPLLVTFPKESFGSPSEADELLRRHLYRCFGDRLADLAKILGWSKAEVDEYFTALKDRPGLNDASSQLLQGILEPERYQKCYSDSVVVQVSMPFDFERLPNSLSSSSSSSQPLVSWLIPARNAEDFILDCLRSIDNQVGLGNNSYEVVIVEDASTDGTAALISRFAETRAYVKLVETNGMQLGVAGALQEGWSHCSGKFIARLDADDEAEPDRLLKQLRYMDQHPSVSVLGGSIRNFWSELRKCSIDRISKREDGRVAASVWREDHGNQTSRKREEVVLERVGDDIMVANGPAEYFNCRILRVGEESLALNPDQWKEALGSAQGKKGDVILQRRDPFEPPKINRWLHPSLIRYGCIFEECIFGSTMFFRRSHYEECPYPREQAESFWCCLSLGPHRHAANIADPLVRARRHQGNLSTSEVQADIHESKCAAVQFHLKNVYGLSVDMNDAEALINCRGPRTPEQGEKLLEGLQKVELALLSEYIRPQDKDEFWEDFIDGREVALERAMVSSRMRFKAKVDEVKTVITNVPEHSPRQHRNRELPR
eukprot:TRINITY_DN8472_c0_g1_i1.p1 TRINITY_DN8472_c0_g1~~TRINITY_DN8472_c0_g1_i1.p1  ORF type:complete len:676 (-),score=111.91 TRINITY_DN8472_c0_g1_i1:143-1990(-)